MSKAFSIITLLLLGIYCNAQTDRLATSNLDDSTDLTFTIKMLKIETSCLSSQSDVLWVTIHGDSSVVMLIPNGNYRDTDSIIRKLVKRNILKELTMFEIDINNNHCENELYLIHFDGPLQRGHYGTCDPKLLLSWLEAL